MRTRELVMLLGVVACSDDNNNNGQNNNNNVPVATVNHLVSNDINTVPALASDPKLVNAWGLAAGPGSPWWVADNGTGFSTLYDGSGNKQALEVTVPGSPTGLVFNGGTGFNLNGSPATFIFASEDGTISAWNATAGTAASVVVDDTALGAIYKGLALSGDQLFATDFHNNAVVVFDSSFNEVTMATGAFVDPSIPAGYAPFGIAALNGNIVVTYALQDANAEDDVKGAGHGFIDEFDTSGTLIQQIASQGLLDSPWGLVMAPATFGQFPNELLVGNFGDGHITAFDLNGCATTCTESGQLSSDVNGAPVVIDGLWALAFGMGNANTGPADALFFTAGPNDEVDGLFGSITVATQSTQGNQTLSR